MLKPRQHEVRVIEYLEHPDVNAVSDPITIKTQSDSVPLKISNSYVNESEDEEVPIRQTLASLTNEKLTQKIAQDMLKAAKDEENEEEEDGEENEKEDGNEEYGSLLEFDDNALKILGKLSH